MFYTPGDYERYPKSILGLLATSMVMLFGGTALLIYFPWKKEFLYRLQIGSAGGEKHALESERSGDIQPIVDALSKAIVARG